MSSGGTGGGGGIVIHPKAVIFHPSANATPPQVDVTDLQAWCDSLTDDNPLKAQLQSYLDAIPD